MFPRGTHIKIWCGAYWHHGIYIGDDTVVHFTGVRANKTAASVRYGSLAEFAGSAGVLAIEVVEYARCFDPEEVIRRAHRLVGRDGYNVINNNCEASARWCMTGEFESNQVETVKAAGAGAAGTTVATAAALGTVSAAGVVVGTSAPGVMSGLASAGAVVGGGAAAGVAVLAATPAAVATAATHRAFRDDPALPDKHRRARRAARTAGTAGAVAGTLGTIGAVSAAGVPGLSAVGISTGLTAIGGTMMGGVAVTVAAPAALAVGFAYLVYRIAMK